MSGILDSKSRIIDAILTVEGRRQLAEGNFEISYATFTDIGVSYIPDDENGHSDPTNKIYLEACSLPQDQITFESNDSGKLNSLRKQEIKIDYKNFPSSSLGFRTDGVLEDGRLSVYKYVSGRTLRVLKDLGKSDSDTGKGFKYSDSLGNVASILFDASTESEKTSKIISDSVTQVQAKISSKDGLGAEALAYSIKTAVDLIRLAGGPNVVCEVYGNTVYFDVGVNQVQNNLIFETIGELSSPLLLNNSSVGGTLIKDTIQNAQFASEIKGILSSSFDNFLKLQTLSSINRLFEDDQFELSTNEITFNLGLTATPDLIASTNSPLPLNSIDSLFSDDKMSHLDNFLYLPPIVKTSNSEVPDKSRIEDLRPYFLGDYPSWGDNEKKLTYQKLKKEIDSYKDKKNPIEFVRSSIGNNVISQVFEITSNQVNKLDIVDFGFVDDVSQEGVTSKKKVFFVGKTFIDNRGTVCFVNMFTLIFSSNPDNKENNA